MILNSIKCLTVIFCLVLMLLSRRTVSLFYEMSNLNNIHGVANVDLKTNAERRRSAIVSKNCNIFLILFKSIDNQNKNCLSVFLSRYFCILVELEMKQRLSEIPKRAKKYFKTGIVHLVSDVFIIWNISLKYNNLCDFVMWCL